MARVEGMVVGQAALAHVGHDQGDLQVLGERAEFRGGAGEDDAAAQDQDGRLPRRSGPWPARWPPGPARDSTRAGDGRSRDGSRLRPSARRAADRPARGRGVPSAPCERPRA